MADDEKAAAEPSTTIDVQETPKTAAVQTGPSEKPISGPNSALDPLSRDFGYGEWLQDRVESDTILRCEMGVAYRNLNVFGFGTSMDYQKTLASSPLVVLNELSALVGRQQKSRIDILRDFEGCVRSGEMLMVLGRPGSGCTTFLKTLAGRTFGFFVDGGSELNYQGIPMKTMHSEFRGEISFQAESDVHFPNLTVSQTLAVAAQARAPRNAIAGSNRKAHAQDVTNATVAALGLAHTVDVQMGNEFVRGVSGGERKRASIAEILVGGTALQCWDNSTRGLDSANAVEFVRTLRLSTRTTGAAAVVTMYQASQAMYDVFDKVVVLYEGRQIYFGSITSAKRYFTDIGFVCPERAITSDFLTSLTNPAERIVQIGYEMRVPRTADEFASIWQNSPERAALLQQMDDYGRQYPLGGEHLTEMRRARKIQKAYLQRQGSPYTISFADQVKLCLDRAFQRLKNDPAPPISGCIANSILAIVLGSMFYNLAEDTSSFYGRGVILFFTILLNTTLGAFEGTLLWPQRPIVEKHRQLAFYHPMTEAIASMISDLPYKIILTFFFNIPFYFLANLHRTAGAFFTFYLFAFVAFITGSMLFRLMGSVSVTVTDSIAPGCLFVSLLVIYTGFVLPTPYMHPWLRWFAYINPVQYAFESLMINEFSGRQFPCADFIPSGPGYETVGPFEKMCSTVGATAGSSTVDGSIYIETAFLYYPQNLWRNLGIIFAFMIFFCTVYLLATEYILQQRSKGEVLLFRRGHVPELQLPQDEENQIEHESRPIAKNMNTIHNTTDKDTIRPASSAATFLWDELSYDVKVKNGHRRLLDDVEGWIQPGTLTALMGASGAGKTTLLNTLANRTSTGIVGGEKIANAQFQDAGFARKIGYAQQMDVHLTTSTVREALIFSALLRQPETYSREEKLAYVNEVIESLDMGKFADAVIGVLGEGLNVEQRKRLTIAVELAARPELLLFLDEPTSGLDSDTAWSICTLLRKLADNGQAILCTIHQPSATLFTMFDRLLFLVDGKSVYFGDIGPDSETLVSYFEKHGARPCGDAENPAEWLLDVTGGAPRSQNTIDWSTEWQNSSERRVIKEDLTRMKEVLARPTTNDSSSTPPSHEFATTFWYQLTTVTARNFAYDWRTPSYLWSRILLVLSQGLVNGFSFYKSDNSLQGLQNQLFSVFILLTLVQNMTQLIMPLFVAKRDLYEVRERPSRTYSWWVFVLSNVLAEVPWLTGMAVLMFVSWYYPAGFWRNAEALRELNERGGLMFLLVWSYMLWCATFSLMMVAGLPDAATAVNIASLLAYLAMLFGGVLVAPSALPRFWIFMYRVSPITYFISAMTSTATAGVPITCSATEIISFLVPSSLPTSFPSTTATATTCATYLTPYMTSFGGSLLNPDSTTLCHFCQVADTSTLLEGFGIRYAERWWQLGVTLGYSLFNVGACLGLYWLARVPKGGREGGRKGRKGS